MNPANGVPRTRLEPHFHAKMPDVPLFKDLETYVGTMPTRRDATTMIHYLRLPVLGEGRGR